MSLQVWLPLNGNLNNQGLSNVTVANNGATVDSSGKIGSCYLVNSDKKISFSSYSWMTMKPQYNFSCFLWVKGTTSGWLFACSAWELMLRPSFIQVHLAGNGQYPARYTATFDTNTWYHLGFTWSGTEGKLRLYLNGSLVATSDVPSSASYDIASSFNIPYDGPRYVNDFRLYDHCLSAKEVKEISKGLICHYKLNNKGFGSPNLLAKSSIVNRGCTSLSYDSTSNTWTGVAPTGSSNWGYGVTFSNSSNKISVPIGTTACFSLEVNPDVNCSCNADVNNATTDGSNPSGNDNDDTSKRTTNGYNLTANKWNKVYWTYTAKNYNLYDANSNWGIVTTNLSSPVNFKLRNIKVEYGTKPTAWCPHTSDNLYTLLGLNSTVEDDCSGYKNNGNKIGSVLSSESSGRYSTSTYCNSTNVGTNTTEGASFIRCTLANPIINATALTINWWGNIEEYSYQNSGILSLSNSSSYPSDYENSALAQYDSIFRFNLTNGNNSSIGSLTLIETGNWHMYTLVFNNGVVQGYRDGEVITSNSKSGNLAQFIYIYLGINQAGGVYRQTKSKWSDFRIYSTALSASDIKELYNTSASIDKSGNIYAYEFKEE